MKYIIYFSFVVFSMLVLIGLIGSKNKYDYFLSASKKEIPARDILKLGMFWMEKIDIQQFPFVFREAINTYNYKLINNITSFYGAKYSVFYTKAYHAQKWSIAIFGGFLSSIFGTILVYQKSTSYIDVFLMGICLSFGLGFLFDNKLKEKLENKRIEIQLDFPDFANKLILLINTGMVVKNAWSKIVKDTNKDTALYRELRQTMIEIEMGKAEIVAYEDMSDRCKIREISKFITVICMNINRGGREMTLSLKLQADECWVMRKNTAKRLGEKASTKLLIPIGIMLIGVMIVTVTPAVLMLSGGF